MARKRPAKSATRRPATPARKGSGRGASPSPTSPSSVPKPPAKKVPSPPRSLWSKGERRRAEIAVVLLLVSPAVIIPGGLNRFVFGKLLIAAVGVAVAASVPAAGRLTNLVRGLLVAASGVTAIAALTSESPLAGMFGRQPLSEGVFVLGTYLLAGLMGARLLGPRRSPRLERTAIAAMAWCALAVAALAVFESAGLRPLSSTLDRPGSLLGNASDQGVLGILYGAPLLVAAIRDRRALTVFGVLAATTAVVLSASRGALIGFAAALIVVAILSAARARPVAFGALTAAAALAFSVPFTRDRILSLTPLASQTVGGRGLLWSESLSLYGDHYVLGVGPNGFAQTISTQHDFAWQRTIGADNPPGTPHNWLLQVLLVGGPILLLATGVIVALTIRGALVSRRIDVEWSTGLLAGLAGAGTAFLFHFPAPSTAVPAALFAGGLLAVAPEAATRRAMAQQSVVLGSAALLSVCFVLSSVAEMYLKSGFEKVAAKDFRGADSELATARGLRIWDVDLPFQAAHQFIASATSGDEEAVPFAERWASRLEPVAGDEQVVQNRAALLQLTGQDRQALAVLDAPLRTDRDNAQLLLLRGVVNAKLRKYPEAIRDLQRVTVVDPTAPKPWRNLAIVYRATGNETAASRAETKVRQLGG